MIYQDNHVTLYMITIQLSEIITFAPITQPLHRQLCSKRDRHSVTVSLYHYNAVLSDDKDKFQESETNQIITGSDSSVMAAIIRTVRSA